MAINKFKMAAIFSTILAILVPCLLISATSSRTAAKNPSVDIQKNPYEFVWFEEGGQEQGLVRFAMDINNDGKEELFLAPKSRCEETSCGFHVFTRGTSEYEYLGTLPLNTTNLELLNSGNRGFSDLKTLLPTSMDRGVVTTYRFDGEQYSVASTEEFGAAGPLEVSTSHDVAVEFSGATLTWKPGEERQRLFAEAAKQKANKF